MYIYWYHKIKGGAQGERQVMGVNDLIMKRKMYLQGKWNRLIGHKIILREIGWFIFNDFMKGIDWWYRNRDFVGMIEKHMR